MAGLSVVSSPQTNFANTFAAPASTYGAVPGVAQTSNSGVNLQGTGGFNNASIAVPAAPKSNTSTSFDVPQYANNIPTVPIIGSKTPATTAVAAQTPLPTTDLYYNGVHYTNQNDYQNAVIADVNNTHTQTVNQINTAYKQGLISFDQQQKLIDQSRTNLQTQTSQALQALQSTNQVAQDSQAAHFATADANAVSSRQGELADQTKQQYQQSVDNTNTNATQQGSALDTSAQNLQQQESNFGDQYKNSLTAADQAQTQGADAVKNAGISFQNTVAATQAANSANSANAASANAPTQTQYDPQTLTANLANYVINSASTAPTNQPIATTVNSALVNASNTLAAQGINPTSPGASQILSYLQGQFADPTSALYKNLVAKTPLSYAGSPVTGQ